MADITWADKTSGNTVTAADMNQIKAATNSKTTNITDAASAALMDSKIAAITVDPTYSTLTFGATTQYPYTDQKPNAYLAVTGNTTINLTGTANGKSGLLKVTKSTGSEVITLSGIVRGTQRTMAGTDYISWINESGTIVWFYDLEAETGSTIRSKLGITTLSGSNTGDQDLSTYATKTGSETLTNKTLTAPVIGSIINTGTLTLPTTTGTIALTSQINVVIGTFTSALDFTLNRKFNDYTQTGAIAFTLASVTHVVGNTIAAKITGNGSNDVSFSSSFIVFGTFDNTKINYLTFYCHSLTEIWVTILTGTASLSTPSAPTTPVTNDTDDSFGWTDTGGKTYANAEIKIGTDAYINANGNPHTGITGAYANGEVLVRYKAVAGVSNASATLANTSPFTAAAAGTENLASNSHLFYLSPYTKQANVNILTDQSSPLGATSGSGLTTNGTSNASVEYVGFPLVSGQLTTLSLYAKAGQLTSLNLSVYTNNFAEVAVAQYNLSNGTVTSQSGGTASAVLISNGWYRLILTYTAGVTEGGHCYFGPANPTASGYVDTLYVDGLQINTGGTVKAYLIKP